MDKGDMESMERGVFKQLESQETLIKATMYSVDVIDGANNEKKQDHYVNMTVVPKTLDGRCPSQVVVRYLSKTEQEDFFGYGLKDSKIKEAEALPSKMMRDLGVCFVHVMHMN